MIRVEAETLDLSTALTALAKYAKVDFGAVYRQEAQYLVREILRFTPPKTAGQGKAAVARDIGRIATTLDANSIQASADGPRSMFNTLAKYVRKRENGKLRTYLQNPHFRDWNSRILLSSVDEIRDAHVGMSGNNSGLRNRRGNVAKNKRYVAYQSDLKKYLREVQKRVGWAAAGWQALALQCGADKLSGTKKWSAKIGSVAGTADTNFSGNGKPFIYARAKNNKIPDYQRMIDGAVRSRRNTTVIKLERVLNDRAVNLGFTKIGKKMTSVSPTL